jgi:hypothetical protein
MFCNKRGNSAGLVRGLGHIRSYNKLFRILTVSYAI